MEVTGKKVVPVTVWLETGREIGVLQEGEWYK